MHKENSIKEDIRKYILEASLSNPDDLQDNTLIFESGLLDSMGLLFLIEFLNDNYSVEVNDEELNPKNFESINTIVDFVNIKQKIKI